jgi:hypothetical protein
LPVAAPRSLFCHAAILSTLLLVGCGTKKDDKEPTQREQIGQAWKYEEKRDPQSGAPIPVAYIGSANSAKTLSAPDTFAVMLLQKMRNGQTSVTIKAVGAPFTCDLSDCSVKASIDGGKAKSWQGRITDANDGVTLPPPQKAYEEISNSKTVMVELNLGPEGVHPFEFRTVGLEWAK